MAQSLQANNHTVRDMPGATTRALPAAGPSVVIRPYVMTQLLADLGESETNLSARVVKHIAKSLPIPAEQQILWADVAISTRTHGVVLTDAGIFLKDGPIDADEDESDQQDDDTDADDAQSAQDGLGYRYIRWESFDPARISHKQGHPTLDGEFFLDGPRFRRLAMACVRINNRRVLTRKAGRKAVRGTGLFGQGIAVRSVCRISAGKTVEYCFDADGDYKFLMEENSYDGDGVNHEGEPKYLEVPLDQYDAVLQRMRKRIAAGDVPCLDDPDMVGVLVRCGWYTYRQAVNLAMTGRIPHVEYRPKTGSVVCRDPRGLGYCLSAWLRGRTAVVHSRPTEKRPRGSAVSSAPKSENTPDNVAEQTSESVGQALAQGAYVQQQAGKDERTLAGENAARFVADNAASNAGYAVGATGARVLMSAVGIASGPLAMIASLTLGNMAGKAGGEAIAMAKDLIFEPKAQIMERLFNGVVSNVVFEYALTGAEQEVLAELMTHANAEIFQRLGAALADSPNQEVEIRKLLIPMVQAIRRA